MFMTFFAQKTAENPVEKLTIWAIYTYDIYD